jgi:hypothetical protein
MVELTPDRMRGDHAEFGRVLSAIGCLLDARAKLSGTPCAPPSAVADINSALAGLEATVARMRDTPGRAPTLTLQETNPDPILARIGRTLNLRRRSG